MAQHYLYVKEHNVRESHVTKPRDKTLFVLNVPPYCNEVKANVICYFWSYLNEMCIIY